MNKPVGVLVMAYGGPASLDEIPGYLADIRAGRVTSKAILDEITDNYRQIGGRSPLPEKTAAQIAALAARFGACYSSHRSCQDRHPSLHRPALRLLRR